MHTANGSAATVNSTECAATGPLTGVRVVEFAGIGPAPLCGMLLADMGAEVLLIERAEPASVGLPRPRRYELAHRGKRSLVLNLKDAGDWQHAADLLERADVALEGFRPGVMERLGLGPDAVLPRNPRLIYARLTGWGQTGPLAHTAGHDLNYVALAGVLGALGRADWPPQDRLPGDPQAVPHDAPQAPINLLGDYAGGALSAAFGIVCALQERTRSGRGQVLDAAMTEGAALLTTPLHGLVAAGLHAAPRGHNLLDGGAPHYGVYRCADGGWVAFGAIERAFRQAFAERAGLDDAGWLLAADDPAHWPAVRERLTALFASRTVADWCALTEGSDACLTPVPGLADAPMQPQAQARQSFVTIDGLTQPAPAPRLARTPGAVRSAPPQRGEGGAALAAQWLATIPAGPSNTV